jgi:hypothetical protein
VQHNVRFPYDPRYPVTTYACARLLPAPDGALQIIGCGAVGAHTIAATSFGQICGTLQDTGSGLSGAVAVAAERCFWQAYIACQHATTLIYEDYREVYATHILVLQPIGGGCTVMDDMEPGSFSPYFSPLPPGEATGGDAVYTCAGLAQSVSGGLTARSCGSEGDVAVPSVR